MSNISKTKYIRRKIHLYPDSTRKSNSVSKYYEIFLASMKFFGVINFIRFQITNLNNQLFESDLKVTPE